MTKVRRGTHRGSGATGHTGRGGPVAELATDAAEHVGGLVVVATHGRAGLQAIWSPSVAARLLKRAQAPVLLVPITEPEYRPDNHT